MEHAFTSSALRDLASRGLLDRCSAPEDLDAAMAAGPVTAYAGFDATAGGLHAGHLVVLTALRRLAEAGHRVIVLVGGATSLVGDPSFRNATRPMLDEETVARNAEGIVADVRAVMGDHAVTFADNSDWLSGAGFLSFMRDVGAEFTVARMTAMESVRGRLEKNLPVTMLEFSYMLLQAADFRELSRRHGCVLQIGGSDQWGNICNGIELARRTDGKRLFGLTVPLLVSSDGTKMGKTADGAAWLSPGCLDPFSFRQFWRNVRDEDAGRFARMFMDDAPDAADVNALKEALADAVTRRVHGEEAAAAAAARAAALFSGDGTAETVRVGPGDGVKDLSDLLVHLGFAPSRSAARRLVEGGGARIDETKAHDPLMTFEGTRGPLTVSAGRRRKAAVEFGGAAQSG